MQQKRLIFATGCLLFGLCLPLSAARLDGRELLIQDPQTKPKDIQQPPDEEPEGAILISWNSCGLISNEGASSRTGTTLEYDGATLYFVSDHCVSPQVAEKELRKQLQRKEIQRIVEIAGRALVQFSEPVQLEPEIPRHSQLRYAYIWIEGSNVLGLYGPTSEHVMGRYHATPEQFSSQKKN